MNKTSYYFNKKFEFSSDSSWSLPKSALNEKKWHLKKFQGKKLELNNVKSLLNKFDIEEWSKHTRYRDPSSFINRKLKQINPELLTGVNKKTHIFSLFYFNNNLVFLRHGANFTNAYLLSL